MNENFDDILRRRWEERQFPVDDRHRAAMAELLRDRKRRKFIPIWWFAGVVGIAAVTALFITLSHETPPVQIQAAADTQQDIPVSETQETHVPDADEMSASVPAPEPQVPHREMEAGGQIPSETSRDKGQKEKPRSSSVLRTPVSTGSKARPATDKAFEKERKENQTKSEESIRVQDQPRAQAGSKPDMTTAETVAVYENIEGNPTGTSTESGVAEKSELFRNAVQVDFISALDIDGLNWEEDVVVGPVRPQMVKHRPVYLLAEAAGSLVFGSQPEYTSGWRLRAGAGLGYDISRRVNLLWTAGYMLQQGGFSFERTSTVEQAGFGARSSFNTLSPDRLHHVYSRLGVNYRIHRHILHGYLGGQWLYGAQGKLAVQTQDQFTGDQETERYTWLKTDGLRKLRWSSGLAYGYQLTPGIMAMAGAEMYFSSFTTDDRSLTEEGYYWDGTMSNLHPYITFNYILYGKRK